jgi:DNA-binding transcriptional LysR family regulator
MDDRALDITLLTNSCKADAAGAEVLLTEPIVWAGAKGGCAHMKEPLPVSVWEEGCAWRAIAIEALGRDGRNYRIAYMSAHTAGQRAAIMADLAVAPLPKSFITGDMVELGPKHGMPVIGDTVLQCWSLRMPRRPSRLPRTTSRPSRISGKPGNSEHRRIGSKSPALTRPELTATAQQETCSWPEQLRSSLPG